jgi:hypothetical protein
MNVSWRSAQTPSSSSRAGPARAPHHNDGRGARPAVSDRRCCPASGRAREKSIAPPARPKPPNRAKRECVAPLVRIDAGAHGERDCRCADEHRLGLRSCISSPRAFMMVGWSSLIRTRHPWG